MNTPMNRGSFREQFDLLLDGYIQQQIESVTDNHSMHVLPLIDYLQEYHQWGKRFRPFMVYLWHKLCGGTHDVYDMMQVGIINELIHLFALIQDDIIDQWTTRHHIPCYHHHLRDLYKNDHFGDSQAVLVGNLLHAWAIQWLVKIDNQQARTVIADMIEKVLIWQMIDVHYSAVDTLAAREDIAKKDDLKSGQYTFSSPMIFGARLADASDAQIELIEKIGTTVGIAFQMRDDLLDWIPDDEGKTKFSDIHEGNQTIVWSTLLDQLDDNDTEQLLSLRKKDLTDEDKVWINDVIHNYDIKQLVAKEITTLLDQWLALFNSHTWDPAYTEHFIAIIDFLRIND